MMPNMGFFRKLGSALFRRWGTNAPQETEAERTSRLERVIQQTQERLAPTVRLLNPDETRLGPSEMAEFKRWVDKKQAEKRAGKLDRDFEVTPEQWRRENRDDLLDRTIAETRRLLKKKRDTRSHLEQFLDGDIWLETPQSSNVAKFRFLPKTEDQERGRLHVVFKDGNEYYVFGVTDLEARNWYHAQSKGKWYWDHVRIRGTKLGHKKPYEHIAHGATVRRKWVDRGADSIAAHLDQVKEESTKHGAEGVVPSSYLDAIRK